MGSSQLKMQQAAAVSFYFILLWPCFMLNKHYIRRALMICVN